MDIFYINCFSHSLYLSCARNISCFSCFLTIIYAIYMLKLNTYGGKGKIKTQGDTQKAKESGAECDCVILFYFILALGVNLARM